MLSVFTKYDSVWNVDLKQQYEQIFNFIFVFQHLYIQSVNID